MGHAMIENCSAQGPDGSARTPLEGDKGVANPVAYRSTSARRLILEGLIAVADLRRINDPKLVVACGARLDVGAQLFCKRPRYSQSLIFC